MSKSPAILIEAGKSNRLYIRDLWVYRELFFMLAWRDILVRYKQTVIGIAWAVLRPLLTMIVFTVVFGKIAKLPSDDIPYVLMVFAGMLPWQLFSSTVATGGESLIGNQALISKVYFPRLIIPSASMVVSFVDFLISSVIFVPLFIWYQYIPSWRIVFLPVFLVLTMMLALGATYIITSLNVKYRDFRYVVPFMIQFGLYISPVGFLSNVVPEKWRLLYACNPMVGVIDGVRWALFHSPLNIHSVVISVLFAMALLLGGFVCFRRMEKEFADFI